MGWFRPIYERTTETWLLQQSAAQTFSCSHNGTQYIVTWTHRHIYLAPKNIVTLYVYWSNYYVVITMQRAHIRPLECFFVMQSKIIVCLLSVYAAVQWHYYSRHVSTFRFVHLNFETMSVLILTSLKPWYVRYMINALHFLFSSDELRLN